MKQTRSLKQRLIASVLVLVMLFTSLIGSTFAWFTDSASSDGNTIQTGNLKVDLLHKTGDDWVSVKDNPDHKVFDYDKWEPGYTRVETLKVANLGSLALKYKLSVEALDGTAVTGANGENLADVIEVYITYGETNESNYSDITSSDKWVRKGTLTEVLKAPASFMSGNLFPSGQYVEGSYDAVTGVGNQIVKIALHMKEDAGNEYQKLSIGDVSVNIVATQWTYENDSFGSDYDKDSVFPELNIGGITVDVQTANGVVTNPATISGEGVSGIIPAGVAVDSGVNKLGLSVTEKAESDANLTLNDGEALRSLDVHMYGVSKNNTVPMLITVEQAMKPGLNIGNYTLYHLENGVTVAMTAVNTAADLDAHNEFYYDPATGDVTLAMATFSEVDFIAEASVWEGNFDYSWYTGVVAPVDEEGTIEYTIANADQLAAFGAIVGGMAEGIERDSFKGKTVKLVANINLGDANDASTNLFYPIGYYNDAGHYNKPTDGTKTAANVTSFQGTFDGQGNKISNFYQNTWQMWGNYDGNYYKAAMGLFGYVYGGTVKNLTVSNFSSDGEYTPTGVIAAFAAGNSTFENIAIFDCNPRVYNTGNGGIIGIAGDTSAANDDHITLKNITVDNSNKISALWGSYDVACGGLVGMYRGNVDGSGNATGDTIEFINCHVSAQIDVYNDVCGNYQYYAYRYAGMIIGSVRHNEKSDGKTIPAMAGISASGCTVNYGDWNDYYYCEFEKNGHPSYSGPTDYKFSRVPHSELNFTDSNGNGVVDANERATVTGCKHDHTENEDNQAIFLPFYQLFTGYSWGVSSIGLAEYSGIVTNLDITEGDQQESVTKFNGKVSTLVDYTTYKLGDLFAAVENCDVAIVDSGIAVSVVSADSANPVSANISYDKANWENGTITFTGAGTVSITIQDYFFCTPTTISVTVTEHEHKYDNACDTTCNVCGEEREITHTYDNDCDATCNVCGAERGITHDYTSVVTPPTCTEKGYTTYTCACGHFYVADETAALNHTAGEAVKENSKNPDCVNTGSYDSVVYCTVCDAELSRTTITVDALNHTAGDTVVENNVAPTCTKDGSYDNVVYCTVCDAELSRETITVDALGHTAGETVVENNVDPDCTNEGSYDNVVYCTVCGEELSRETVTVKENGHTEGAPVKENNVDPDCTNKGSYDNVVYCTVCDAELSRETVTVDAHGHKEETLAAVEATCTTTGLTAGKQCSVCNKVTVVQDIVPVKPHTEVVDQAVPAKCNETGLTAGKHCSVCNTVLEAQTIVEALGHIEKNFTGDFLYRVGNQNAVQLKSLFNIGNHNVTVSGAKVAGNASVTINGTSLQFNKTGVVKITLSSDCTCNECDIELTLEVVDAVNATGATSATNNNVVLLNDCGFSSLEVSGGYTLYGNGFTMTCGSDSYALDFGYEFVKLNNGILDNVQIVCPNFDYAALYKKNLTSNDNRSYTDSNGTKRYYNARSGVMVSGDSQILNSRISGARAAVNVTGGNCLIDNSRLEGGAVATLLIGSANSVTLRDVTLVQKPTASTYNSSKVLMGFSVLVICNSGGTSTPITLEGTLIQDAWIDENDAQYVPDDAKSIITEVLGKTDYLHDLDGDGTKESLNLGIAYMPADGEATVNQPQVADNRTNKDDIPYASVSVKYLVSNTYVFSYKSSKGTDESFKDVSEYKPNKYGDIIAANYSDDVSGLEFGKSFGTDGWVYELNVDLDKASGYKLDFSKLAMTVNGVPVTDFMVNGSAKPTSPVAVTAGGTTYTLTVTVNGKEHNVIFKVTGVETAKRAPYLVDKDGNEINLNDVDWGAGTRVTSGSDWSAAAPVLKGIYVKYWSVSAGVYKVVSFEETLTPSSSGKQNESNNWWQYTSPDGDFTLRITNTGAIHSSKGVYGMPVVYNNVLYFTISSTDGMVSSSSGSRNVAMEYVFTDNNSGSLTFNHTWTVNNNTTPTVKYTDMVPSEGGGGCVTGDTLVTLADGTQKRVDELTYDDVLLVWDFYKGEYTTSVPSAIYNYGDALYNVTNLKFSDGTVVKMITEHEFFDVEKNSFVYICESNVAEFVGREFLKVDGDGYKSVVLNGYEFTEEYTGSYTVLTAVHYNCITEGMFSLTADPSYKCETFFRIFEVGEGMKFDEAKMQEAIDQYGLYTYEDFAEYVTYEEFIAFGGAYFKILVEQGLLTFEDILIAVATYAP